MSDQLSGDAGPGTEPRTRTQIAPKVGAAGVGGAFAVLVVYLLSLAGVELTTEVSAALATVFAFAAGYLKQGE